jgi:hypothetical protein
VGKGVFRNLGGAGNERLSFFLKAEKTEGEGTAGVQKKQLVFVMPLAGNDKHLVRV